MNRTTTAAATMIRIRLNGCLLLQWRAFARVDYDLFWCREEKGGPRRVRDGSGESETKAGAPASRRVMTRAGADKPGRTGDVNAAMTHTTEGATRASSQRSATA